MKTNTLTFITIIAVILSIITTISSATRLYNLSDLEPTTLTAYQLQQDAMNLAAIQTIFFLVITYVLSEIVYCDIHQRIKRRKIKNNLSNKAKGWTSNIKRVIHTDKSDVIKGADLDIDSKLYTTPEFDKKVDDSFYESFLFNILTIKNLDLYSNDAKELYLKWVKSIPIRQSNQSLRSYFEDIWYWYNSSTEGYKRNVSISAIYNYFKPDIMDNSINSFKLKMNEWVEAIPEGVKELMYMEKEMEMKVVDRKENWDKPNRTDYPIGHGGLLDFNKALKEWETGSHAKVDYDRDNRVKIEDK